MAFLPDDGKRRRSAASREQRRVEAVARGRLDRDRLAGQRAVGAVVRQRDRARLAREAGHRGSGDRHQPACGHVHRLAAEQRARRAPEVRAAQDRARRGVLDQDGGRLGGAVVEPRGGVGRLVRPDAVDVLGAAARGAGPAAHADGLVGDSTRRRVLPAQAAGPAGSHRGRGLQDGRAVRRDPLERHRHGVARGAVHHDLVRRTRRLGQTVGVDARRPVLSVEARGQPAAVGQLGARHGRRVVVADGRLALRVAERRARRAGERHLERLVALDLRVAHDVHGQRTGQRARVERQDARDGLVVGPRRRGPTARRVAHRDRLRGRGRERGGEGGRRGSAVALDHGRIAQGQRGHHGAAAGRSGAADRRRHLLQQRGLRGGGMVRAGAGHHRVAERRRVVLRDLGARGDRVAGRARHRVRLARGEGVAVEVDASGHVPGDRVVRRAAGQPGDVVVAVLLDVDLRPLVVVDRPGGEVQRARRAALPTPPVDDVVHEVEHAVLVAHADLPLVVAREHVVVERDPLPQAVVVRQVQRGGRVLDEVPGDRHVAHVAVEVHRPVVAAREREVVEHDVVDGVRLAVEAPHVGDRVAVASGADVPEVVHDDVVGGGAAARLDHHARVHGRLGDGDAGRGRRGAVDREVRRLDAQMRLQGDGAGDVEHDVPAALRERVAQRAAAAVGEARHVVRGGRRRAAGGALRDGTEALVAGGDTCRQERHRAERNPGARPAQRVLHGGRPPGCPSCRRNPLPAANFTRGPRGPG